MSKLSELICFDIFNFLHIGLPEVIYCHDNDNNSFYKVFISFYNCLLIVLSFATFNYTCFYCLLFYCFYIN